jgi:hypothetical protein
MCAAHVDYVVQSVDVASHNEWRGPPFSKREHNDEPAETGALESFLRNADMNELRRLPNDHVVSSPPKRADPFLMHRASWPKS